MTWTNGSVLTRQRKRAAARRLAFERVTMTMPKVLRRQRRKMARAVAKGVWKAGHGN